MFSNMPARFYPGDAEDGTGLFEEEIIFSGPFEGAAFLFHERSIKK
jgi:hypothetical protein